MSYFVEYCIAAASHLDTFENELELSLKEAWFIWRASRAPKAFTSETGPQAPANCERLRRLLEAQHPGYCYAVTATVRIRPNWSKLRDRLASWLSASQIQP